MKNKKLELALNEQLNAEFYSAYLYLSMSAYLSSINLNGFSNWTKVQFEEEQTHAMKFYNYINDRGGKVKLLQIDQPKCQWDGIVDVFEEILDHERKVTAMINDLMELALQERDHATSSFLQYFIDEQVEEEANVEDILDQLRLIDGNGTGLFMLDREAKTRILNPIA